MAQQAEEAALAAARDAMGHEDWTAVYDALVPFARDHTLSPDAVPMFAGAAYFTGRPAEAAKVWERIHRDALERGDRTTAARAASEIAGLMLDRDLFVPALTWAARGERLLDGEDSPFLGRFASVRSTIAMARGELEESLAQARLALEIAEHFDDPASLTLAKVSLGQVLILSGDVQEGLALIDDGVMVATSGEVDPFTTSLVFCKAMCSWSAVSDYERAQQWSEAMRLLCEQHEVGASMRGRCRVHRAQVLRVRGACDQAVGEITTALEELTPHADDGERGWILSELGGTRLRLGDLAGAEADFMKAHELGWPPQLGLGRLRLARGDLAAAASVIGDALENPNDLTNFETPPHTDLRRAPLLAALAEVAADSGDVDRAERTAEELTEIADRYGSAALRAMAAGARGDAALARRDAGRAREEFETALRSWRSVNAPYEAASVRMRLARAHEAAGRNEQAVMELRAAARTFDELGARVDARRAAEAERALVGERQEQRETKVFMFTDIVESTTFAEAVGDEAWQHVLRWHNQMLARAIGENRGEMVHSTGDGFFVTFDEPACALDAAAEIQHALELHRREHGFAPQVRIGLHRAEARRDGDDWAGVGVHTAARIGALAEGGEILTSRETAEAAGGSHRVSKPRTVSLKGIREPVEVVRIDWR